MSIKLFNIYCTGINNCESFNTFTYNSGLASKIINLIDKTNKVTMRYADFNERTVEMDFHPALNGVPDRHHLINSLYEIDKCSDDVNYVIRVYDKFHNLKEQLGFEFKDDFINFIENRCTKGLVLNKLEIDEYDKTVIFAKIFLDTFKHNGVQNIWTNEEEIKQCVERLSKDLKTRDDIIEEVKQFIQHREEASVVTYVFGDEKLTLNNFADQAKSFLKKIENYGSWDCVHYSCKDGVITIKFEVNHGTMRFDYNKVFFDVLKVLKRLTNKLNK